MTVFESTIGRLISCLLVCASTIPLAASGADPGNSEWPTYGNDPGGSRYAALTQVTRDNVAKLTQVWSYQTGDLGEGYPSAKRMAFEATPILIDGVLYVSTPYGHVHAIKAATGEAVWQFDAHLPNDRAYSENTSRGVSAWRDPDAAVDAPCALRILFGTLDARLIALDAKTGLACADFGKNGTVDLNEGSRPRDPGNYLVTSPPALWHNLVITGSAVGDNRAVDNELGIVRAFDARTGALVWSWDPIPRTPDNPVYSEWTDEAAKITGAANAWSVLSLDVGARLAVRAGGFGQPGFLRRRTHRRQPSRELDRRAERGDRRSRMGATARASRRVGLRHAGATGADRPATQRRERCPRSCSRRRWACCSCSIAAPANRCSASRSAPCRRTGVDGEVLSPTQPFSALPSLVPNAPLTADDAWGFTPWDRGKCADQIAKLRSEGIYTPPSLQGTVEWPGYSGGSNWGSVSFDPVHQLVIANTNRLPFVVQLIPRDELKAPYESKMYPDSEFARQTGTPYGMRRELIKSPIGVPCTAPPWGTLTAMNLADGINRMAGAARHVARPRAVAGVVHRRRAEHGRFDRDGGWRGLHRRRHRQLPARVRRGNGR